MGPRRFSRYMFSQGFTDPGTGAFMLEDVEPITFVERDDTREHTISEGDTIFHLAERYFPSFERGAGLFWIIANFQPEPPDGIGQISDPTRKLPSGVKIYIPSERFVEEEVFNERRRTDVRDA